MRGEGLPGERDGAVTAFGPQLRRLRMAAGLSQEALAERARISTEAVGALERGTRQAPQRQTLALLIEALGVEGPEREGLERAAVRASSPRRRRSESSLVGVVSALRLPTPLTSFVGRELDLSEVLAAVSQTRLLSLVGPGGVGKSRLALEAARRAGEQFNEGVALIELAPVVAGGSVVSAFAAALGIADEGAMRLQDRLVATCGDGQRLIVVDNCEHVLDDVAAVVFALLSACPNVRVIATSREPLRVDGEQIFRLGPLSTDAAVELFVDRAKAVAPHLHFEPEGRRLAGLICRRVDGIPLAIELAASRSDVFDLSTILNRLQERFKLLAARSRTMHPHHRTLQALVDWSYDLLEPDEARIFRRLGIFAGGSRFDDAEHILAFAGAAPDLVPELLARLHDKSLVDVDRAEPPRFSMLQTIHDYALERLTDPFEAAQLENRFATHYLELCVAAGPDLRSAAQGEAIARLSGDIDNIRVALTLSARKPGLRELGLRALLPLALYWMRTGGLTEGLTQIQSLISDVNEPSVGLASACVGAAFLEFNRRGYREGSAYAVRAYEAATACEDEWLIIYSLNAVTTGLAVLGEQREAAAASAYERAQRFGDTWLCASAAWDVGWEAKQRGDRGTAMRYSSLALELARATGDRFMVMTCAKLLGETVMETDPALAARLTAEALSYLMPGQLAAQAACVESLVEVALALERADDAARLFAVAAALRRNAGGQLKSELVEAVRASMPSATVDEQLGGCGDATLVDASDAIRAFLNTVT